MSVQDLTLNYTCYPLRNSLGLDVCDCVAEISLATLKLQYEDENETSTLHHPGYT